jgi:CheY-like chemotaxis protein
MEVGPKLVLCVGEDGGTFNNIKHALVAEGFSVVLARNGREVLFLASNRVIIDAVVVGLELPDMTVFEATRSVRDLVPSAPIILYSDAPRRILSDLPGFFTDFVPRPNLCELVSVIRRYTSDGATSPKADAPPSSDCVRI